MKKSLLLMLSFLAACSSSPANTAGPGPGPVPTPDTPYLKLNWHYDNPDWYMIGHAELLGNLYMKPGTVKAFDVHTGKPAFETKLISDEGRSSYAQMGDYILVVQRENRMSVLDRSGKALNTVSFPNRPVVSGGEVGPYVTDTSVYVAMGEYVFQYDRDDLLRPGAQPVWMKNFSPQSFGTVMSFNVLSDDELILSVRGDKNNRLISLRADKTERWNIDLLPSNPAAESSTMFIEPFENTVITYAISQGVQAYDRTTGQAIWKDYPFLDDYCPGGGVGITSNATVADGKVFFAPLGNKCVMALDAKTGQFLWSFNSPYNVSFGIKPLYVNDVLYATNGKLWALDADTGKLLAVAKEAVKQNHGTPLAYDPVKNQILTWGGTGIHSYQPVK